MVSQIHKYIKTYIVLHFFSQQSYLLFSFIVFYIFLFFLKYIHFILFLQSAIQGKPAAVFL